MSNISAGSTEGGSFVSSDNTATEALKKNHFHGSSKSQSSASKKKRNLPGTPDPNAEVVALTPETLMATNRFVCEICNKGFQRDQNLQLHRRGHNLPWKLKQRLPGGEAKRRVYVCPEPSCVHHNPARALGDLTGIKKHFSRKHGEKKWKCEKCSKKYAVHSDLKAHSKSCGSKEYKCDCGTLFSRKDSFMTHRAFCDVLAEENSKVRQISMASSSLQSQNLPKLISESLPFPPFSPPKTPLITIPHDLMPIPPKYMFSPSTLDRNTHHFSSSSSLMSATALLQKAAQMGSSSSSSSSSFCVTTMAPSSFGVPGLHTTCLMKCQRENASSDLSFDNVQNGGDVNFDMIDEIPLVNGMFEQQEMDEMKKKAERKINGGSMTLDLFMGSEGGRRRRNFEEKLQHKEEEMGFGGLMEIENVGYFRYEA